MRLPKNKKSEEQYRHCCSIRFQRLTPSKLDLIARNLLIPISQWYLTIKTIGWIPCKYVIEVHWYLLFLKQTDFDSWIIHITSLFLVTKDSLLLWKRLVSIITIFCMDNSWISCSFATKNGLCAAVKKHAFLKRDIILPIESEVSNIFIPNDFPQSDDERYNLYGSFHFPTRSGPLVDRTLYWIADISETSLTEGQMEMVHFERTYCHPLSDIHLSDSERENLHQYPDFNSSMGLIYTSCYEKDFPCEKRKKQNRCLNLKKCVEKGQMFWTLLSKMSRTLTYMPWFCTSTGYKYWTLLFWDNFADLLLILSLGIRQKFLFLFSDILGDLRDDLRQGVIRPWQILQERWVLPQRNLIREISSTCLRNLPLSAETIHRNSESPLISTHLRSQNALEFLYSVLSLLLVVGYFVCIFLYRLSKDYGEFQTELKKVKSLMIPSYTIKLRKLLDRYPTSKLNSFGLRLKNLFLVAMDEWKDSLSVGGNLNINLSNLIDEINIIDLLSIVPNPIHRIPFSINTRHLSHTSKEIYWLIRKREKAYGVRIDEKIESFLLTSVVIDDNGRGNLLQFCNLALTTEKKGLIKFYFYFYWVWPIVIVYQRMTLVIKWLNNREKFSYDTYLTFRKRIKWIMSSIHPV